MSIDLLRFALLVAVVDAGAVVVVAGAAMVMVVFSDVSRPEKLALLDPSSPRIDLTSFSVKLVSIIRPFC